MGLEYYVFAFFVFLLVCIVAFLCRFLFSNVKQKWKTLEEKETKLLRLYQTVEDAMDEFSDLVAEAKEDARDDYRKLSNLAATLAKSYEERERLFKEAPTPLPPKPSAASPDSAPASTPPDSAPTKPRPIIMSDFKKSMEAAGDELADATPFPIPQSIRSTSILELASQGKSRSQIAKELNITQNEVDLVIEMNKNNI